MNGTARRRRRLLYDEQLKNRAEDTGGWNVVRRLAQPEQSPDILTTTNWTSSHHRHLEFATDVSALSSVGGLLDNGVKRTFNERDAEETREGTAQTLEGVPPGAAKHASLNEKSSLSRF